MKQIFILAAALLLLYGNSATAQVQRTPLLEEFTQASCPNCPRANKYINPLLANYPLGQVVAIKYQVDFPGVDTLNLQDPADAATRFAYYSSFNGVPVAAVDGDTGILSTAISPDDYNGDPNILTPAMISSESSLTTPLSLTATFSFNAATDSFTTRLVATNVTTSTFNASSTGKLKLLVSLEEMNIHFAANDHPGDNGEGDFYYINRKMYPSASGTTLPDSIQAGDSIVYTFKEKVPSYIYNKNELGVAAFIQDFGIPQANHSVVQAVFATSSNVTDEIMVDNTSYSTGTLVCSETITPTLQITNNGTTALTSATVSYAIGYSPAVSQNWTGNLTAGQSTNVTFPAVTIPDNTYGNAEYYLTNLNGGTLVDDNDANNTPLSQFLISIPATAALDTITETFDELSEGLVGDVFTPISINADSSAANFGLIANSDLLINDLAYEYGLNTSSTTQCGGYGLSEASFYFALFLTNTGTTDGLVFDKIDRTGANFPYLTFQHAYAAYAGSDDALSVLVSTNCGQTWSTVWTKSGSFLATSPDVDLNTTGLFIPTATQWATDTVNLSAYNNQDNVIVQFQATSQEGNGIYVDNINWPLSFPLGVKTITNVLSAEVYPSPAKDNVTLTLNLTESANFDINIENTLGQNVMKVNNGALNAGTHNMDVNVSGLASGVYNFVINSNGQTMVKRFVVAN